MSSKLIRYAAFLLLFILPGFVDVAVAANADPQPRDILTGIYKEAVKGNTAEWLDPKHRGKYLSKSLLAQWARADKNKEEGDPLDWDLTTDTNALDLKNFDIKVKSESGGRAVLGVKLIYRDYVQKGPPQVVSYDFIREDGRWRIEDMRGRDWSLRDLVKHWQKGG